MHELNTYRDRLELVSIPAPRGPGEHGGQHDSAATALAPGPDSAPGRGNRGGHRLWVTNLGKSLIWCPGLSMVAVAAKPGSAVMTSLSVAAMLLAAGLGATVVQNWLTAHEQPSTANGLTQQTLLPHPDGPRSREGLATITPPMLSTRLTLPGGAEPEDPGTAGEAWGVIPCGPTI